MLSKTIFHSRVLNYNTISVPVKVGKLSFLSDFSNFTLTFLPICCQKEAQKPYVSPAIFNARKRIMYAIFIF